MPDYQVKSKFPDGREITASVTASSQERAQILLDQRVADYGTEEAENKDAEENRLNPKWRDLLWNAPGSLANKFSDVASVASHPVESGTGMAKLAKGIVMHSLGTDPNNLPDDQDPSQSILDKKEWTDSYDLATAMGKDLSGKYGSLKGLKNYAIQDPAGMLGDLSTVAGGAGAGLRAASVSAKMANFARLANTLGKTSNTLGTVSKWTNPLTFATDPATRASRKVAETLAEVGMGIRPIDRLSGKYRHSGPAILDHTSGFTPESIGSSARLKMRELGKEADLLGQGHTVDIGGAQDYARSMLLAAKQGVNRELAGGIGKFDDLLHNPPPSFHGRVTPATPLQPAQIARQQPFKDANRMKGDLTDQISFRNTGPSPLAPATHANVLAFEKRVAGKFMEELGRIPGVTNLNRQISSLVPVARRGADAAFQPTVTERVASRIAARTGALGAALVGGHEFGPAGFLVGLFGQEVISSPLVRLAAARALNMPSKIPPTVANLSKYAALSAAKSNIFGDDEKSGE